MQNLLINNKKTLRIGHIGTSHGQGYIPYFDRRRIAAQGGRFLMYLFLPFIMHTACYAQTNVNYKQAIVMLKEFYAAHQSIESGIRSLPPKVYVRKSDSLQKQYCTTALRDKAKRYSENGIDFLTNDKGIDAGSLKTMTIVKDPANNNIYIVSYDFSDNNYPNTPVKRHIVLHVRVLNEGGHYKIASVK